MGWKTLGVKIKIKAIIILAVIAVMLVGVMVACEASTEEETYRQVSVGSMEVSIPADWERPEEYAELVEELMEKFTNDFDAKMEQVSQLRLYQFPDSEDDVDVALTLLLIDMKQLFELQGLPWEGWEALEGITKEYMSALVVAGIIGEVEEFTNEVN